MHDPDFSALEKMRNLIAQHPRRQYGERIVTESWLDNQIGVHRQVAKVRVPGGRQSAQTVAESEFILQGLEQGELREYQHGSQPSWNVYQLKVRSGAA